MDLIWPPFISQAVAKSYVQQRQELSPQAELFERGGGRINTRRQRAVAVRFLHGTCLNFVSIWTPKF